MNKPTIRRTLAENLRLHRMVRRISQEALAELAGLDRSYVSALERAEVNIGIDNLAKLAGALGVTLVDLLTEPDPQRAGEELLQAVGMDELGRHGSLSARRVRRGSRARKRVAARELVEDRGVEPLTSTMPLYRSTS